MGQCCAGYLTQLDGAGDGLIFFHHRKAEFVFCGVCADDEFNGLILERELMNEFLKRSVCVVYRRCGCFAP